MTRERLPTRRRSVNTSFSFSGLHLDAQLGYYDDGRLAEVFIVTNKVNTQVDVLCRDTALLISMALQYGATLPELARTATLKDDGAPDGLVSVLAQHLKEEGLL